MSKKKFKGSVVLNPVPVVIISTKNKEGKENVFTVAWAGTVCTKPPMLSISVRPERLSYEYLKESMTFVVNMPRKDMVKKVDYCGVRSGRNIDKIEECDFTMVPCEEIHGSYIKECPVSIECKVNKIIPLGTHDMIIADVLCSHIDEDLMDEKGKIHFEEGELITYCHGEYYPMPKKPIGKFGYSVMKKKETKEKKEIKEEHNKKERKEGYNKKKKNKKALNKKRK
ncbi:flavin reductase family protein [uncultured Clostridium sp.]|uniref:flavin reductase family protein n=1 Tax=uncultured Clostridium sp. TaxID=59620 RepID=UPI002616575C|nr:flavin reductase family protein [uncultured Clostridium sp.]